MRFTAIIFVALFIVQSAMAALPPTTLKGQYFGATKQTTFNTIVPNQSATKINGTSALIETGNTNMLANPSFEHATMMSSWTNPLSIGTSTVGPDGTVAPLPTLSAYTGTITEQVTTPDADMSGVDLEESMWVKTAQANVQVCSLLNSVEIQCVDVPTTNQWVRVVATTPGSGTQAHGVRLKTKAAVTGTVGFDGAYSGVNRNIGSIAQATFVGAIGIGGSANYTSATTGAQADLVSSSPTYFNLEGAALAPTGNVNGIRFATLAPGEYEVTYTGGVQVSGASYCVFDIFDGTTGKGGASLSPSAASAANASFSVKFTYTTAQSNITFKVRANQAVANNCQSPNPANLANGSITVKRFPLVSEQVVRADTSGWRIDANMAATTGVGLSAANVASYTEATDASLTLSQNTGSAPVGIACASGTTSVVGATTCVGSRSIGVTFNAPVAGDFKACASFSHYIDVGNNVSTGSVQATFQLVETSASSSAVLQNGKTRLSNQVTNLDPSSGHRTQTAHPIELCGTFNFSTPGQKTIRLQYTQAVSGVNFGDNIVADAAAGTGGGRDIHWSVSPLTQNTPAPLLVGSVTSPALGMIRVIAATLSSTGNIARQDGAWNTPTHTTGSDQHTFSTPFSTPPYYCGCNPSGDSNNRCVVDSYTSGSVRALLRNSAGTLVDTGYEIFCIGPR